MKQQTAQESDPGDKPIVPNADDALADDVFPLTTNERLIIRNYRRMKRSVQFTFVDISEELALALPAPSSSGASAPA